MGTTRWFKFLLFVSLLFLCSSTLSAVSAQTKGTMAYSSLGGQMTGVWMAKEIGAFEKYGIQTDLLYISSGPMVVAALLGGDLHAGVAATTAFVSAVLRGASLISVVSTSNRPSHTLWVQPEINRLEDLRGKTLGVTRFGSVTDNLTRILLRKNGLEGSVHIRQLGGMPEVGAAFQQRVITGAVTSGLRADVPMRMLVKLADMGIPYSMDVIVFSRDYHRRSPQTVEGLVRAYVEGVAAIHHQKEKALKIFAKYTRLNNPKMLEDLYQESVTFLERIPRVEPEAVSTIIEFTGKTGVSLESFVDNSIVDRLVREGFIDKLYKKR